MANTARITQIDLARVADQLGAVLADKAVLAKREK